MPIQVACACGKTYTFKDENAGRQVKCPACGQAMRVPGHAPARPAPEETGRRFSRAEIVAFAVAGGAVLALGVIIPVFLIYGGAKPLSPKEPAAKSTVASAPAEKPAQPAAPAAKTPAEKPAQPPAPTAKTPAEKPAQPPAPTAKTPDETPAQPAAPAEKTPAETPAEPAPPAPDPATTKSAPPVRPAAGGFKVEPFDPAALKAGQYAGRTVCWKAQVLAIKSAQPGIVSVLVYEQGTDRVEADLKFRGNLIAGVGTGRTIVFEGTVERPAAGATAEGPLTLTNVRVDLAALAAEMATPASPPATPAETPATGDAAAPEAP